MSTSSQQPPPSSLPEEDLKAIAANTDSPEDKLRSAAASAESALSSAKTASALRSAAETIRDPAKREKYLQDAYAKEIEAHGNSKKARMLSSGAFQGSMGGGGIGMAVGAGLGTVVGTLVGTVATIPTTAVGTLVGAGVGGVHGPWIKLGDKGDKKGEKGKEGQDGEEKAEGQEEQQVGGEDEGIPDPEALRNVAGEIERQRREQEGGSGEAKERKKPRKLEVRSKS